MTLPWHTASAGSGQGPGQPVSAKAEVGSLTRLHPYEMFETFQAACGNLSVVVPPKNTLLGERLLGETEGPWFPSSIPSRDPFPTSPRLLQPHPPSSTHRPTGTGAPAAALPPD